MTSNLVVARTRMWLAISMSVLACAGASAAVTVLGVQYQQDNPFPEYNCWYQYGNYPTSCGTSITGCNAHVFVKNTGASAVTITDVTLAGYSLKTILQRDAGLRDSASIYYYWASPPQGVFDAGEPIWYRADPNPIPAGGVARVVVRLRSVPVTQPISVGVVTSVGTVITNVPVNASTPVLASVGFSADRTKVYLHWRRPAGAGAGAAPTSVWLDGTNVTSLTTTVGDTNVNFAASVIQLAAPLPDMSYHVYQGIYSDGKTATGSLRTWVNRFIYGTWAAKVLADNDTAGAQAWIDDCEDRGVNALIMNNGSGGLANYLGTTAGRNYADAHDYGYVKDSNVWGTNPRMWFIDDEPDIEEGNVACGLSMQIPCSGHTSGILGMKLLETGESLRAFNSLSPTTINLDGNMKPYGWFTYGQLADVMMVDSYYESEMAGTHWYHPERDPLYTKPTSIYATALATTTAAEPNPSHIILYSCETKDPGLGLIWPFSTPVSKRIEVYYALAGGVKGMAYWWYKSGYPNNGLNDGGPEALALWKEIGLVGDEIKTAQPLLVTGHPVTTTTSTSSGVWARTLAVGVNAMIVFAVNDKFTNTTSGTTQISAVSNATVTVTLPSWLVPPTAFEISAAGLRDVNIQLYGTQLQVNLGTLNVTRMIVLTTDPQLRTTIQQRYDQQVHSGVCAFAPELCVNSPPSITQQPVNRRVAPGGTTNFTVVATGSGTLSYQWQTNTANLSNGAHYSGVMTGNLTVTGASTNDMVNYRCVVTSAYGSVTSSIATLTITNAPATPTANPATSVTGSGFSANWSSASRALGYRLDVSTNNTFGNFVSGYDNLDVGNVTSRSVTGLSSSATYYYRLRAYSEVGSSGNSSTITVTTAVALTPPVVNGATGVTNSGFTANWNSVNGATGYRLDVSTINTFSSFVSGYNNLDVANVLSWSVTGLTTGATYYYRVRAYNGGGTSGNSGTIAVTLAAANPCVAIANADFESGFSIAGGGNIANGWTEWEASPGVVTGFDNTVIVHGGAHSQRIRVTGGLNGTLGGVYQRVPVTAGGNYTVGVWVYADDTFSACSLGVDSGGGTNANNGVTWSLASTNVAWVQQTWTGIATAQYITVFFKVASSDNVRRNGYFDDVTASASTGPLQLTAQRNEGTLTLTWPECPNALLQQADALTAPVSWVTATNQVSVVGGQKSVTLTPTGNAGYFRLVLE